MNKSAVSLLVSLCSAVACAATLTYTPSGSAPYLWSNAQNWGGSLPGSADSVTIASSLLLANPLILQSGSSAAVTTCDVGDGILQIENGASISVSGSMLLANANVTGIVTNYGSMSVGKLALGVYPDEGGTGKGKLAQFDNFGTLNIGTHFRMGIKGTPSIFYNHEGATFNKTGGGQWSFYMATDGGDSTIINEGTMTSHSSCETWTGNNKGGKSEIIMCKSGTFDPGKVFRIGHGVNSTTTVNLYDTSQLLGSPEYRLGHASGSKGYFTLSNEASLVTSTTASLGVNTDTIGSMAFADSSTGEFKAQLRLGCGVQSLGSLTLSDDAVAAITGIFYAGYGARARGEAKLSGSASLTTFNQFIVGNTSSTGMVELAGSSVVTNKQEALLIGNGTRGHATVTVKDNARFVNHATGYLSHGTTSATEGSWSDVTFEGNSHGEFGHYLFIASASNSWSSLAVKDSAEITTARRLLVGGSKGSSGFLSVSGNARVQIGEEPVAGGNQPCLDVGGAWLSRGHVTISGNGLISVTNVLLGASVNNASTGILEVAENGIVSNVWSMKIGDYSAKAHGELNMRGGTVLFDSTHASNGTVIWLNPILDSNNGQSGSISGWGKLAFIDPVAMVKNADKPGGITHYGPIVADGNGQMRDLDCGRLGTITYDNTNPNPVGSTNGWYAVNKGRLKLPRSLPRKTTEHRCVGDYWLVQYGKQLRLANTFMYTLEGAELNNYMFAELYATDRDDIPAGLDAIGADKTLAVWRIGHFSDGPEIDEPTHPAAFTSASLRFRYCADPDLLNGLVVLRVYRHDGTATGKWTCVGRAEPSMANPVISAAVAAPSAANWNMGWFAITGRTKPFGSTLSIR